MNDHFKDWPTVKGTGFICPLDGCRVLVSVYGTIHRSQRNSKNILIKVILWMDSCMDGWTNKWLDAHESINPVASVLIGMWVLSLSSLSKMLILVRSLI